MCMKVKIHYQNSLALRGQRYIFLIAQCFTLERDFIREDANFLLSDTVVTRMYKHADGSADIIRGRQRTHSNAGAEGQGGRLFIRSRQEGGQSSFCTFM